MSDVDEKYKKHCFEDPFKEIPPALLNPQDIDRYINKTGMVHPYEQSRLKSATYGVPLLGEMHYWEEGEKKSQKISGKDDFFELKPNAIVYMHISTEFRVPYYMAFRFNLKIDLVHKGLLLGTGPVVDPGFQGRLLIPIHNLTANTYYLQGEDNLIWVEFTKMSPLEGDYHKYEYKFNNGKSLLDLTANDYFKKANGRKKIVSSIPEATEEARKNASTAIKRTRLITIGGLITAIGLLLGSFSLLTNVVTPTISLVSDYKDVQVKHADDLKKLKLDLDYLVKETDRIRGLLEAQVKPENSKSEQKSRVND